ncbi:hypothetical protein ACV56Z_10115 [Staphylococcus aureus]
MGKNSIEMDDLINQWGMNNDKKQTRPILLITYYWEHMLQLYIEGHSEGVDLTSGQFVLRFNRNKNIRSK